jgi:Na+-driven multidrug efflux pump
VATVIAQALSAVVSIVYMFKKYPFLRFAKGEFRFHRDQAAQALRLSIPTTLQQCIISSGHIAIQRIVNDFGITAAFTAGMRVENFILIPIFAFNVGLATFTGQNVGAGKLDRVRTGLKVTQVMGCIVCAAVAVLAYTAAFPLVGLFGVEGETQALGVQYIHFIAPWLLVFCVYIITNGVLQGAGDVMFTAANTISSLLIRCIAAYLLAYFTPVAGTAAWVSLPIGWVWSLGLALSRYKWGPWRQKAVATAADAPATEED